MRARALVLVAVATAAALSLPSTAHAQSNSGDPLSAVPALLPPGAAYGTATVDPDRTAPNGRTSGYEQICAGESGGLTPGASVYAFEAPAGTRVDVSVVDDIGGQSLCAVELFGRREGAAELASLYDDPLRGSFRAGFTRCPDVTSTCAIGWTVTETDTYYLVFWPGGSGAPDYADFRFTARVRVPTGVALSITRHFETRGGCFRVRAGAEFIAAAAVDPPSATGTVGFRLERQEADGIYRIVGTRQAALSGGRARLTLQKYLFGRYRLRANYLGDDAHAASWSEPTCIDVVGKSAVPLSLAGYYGTRSDYRLVRSGRTFTATAVVRPGPASGSIVFRIYREVGTRDVFVAAYKRALSASQATLPLTLTFRSSSPFWRVRADYLGDAVHEPAISPTLCVQVTR